MTDRSMNSKDIARKRKTQLGAIEKVTTFYMYKDLIWQRASAVCIVKIFGGTKFWQIWQMQDPPRSKFSQ